MGSIRDGQTSAAEAGETEMAASDSGGPDSAKAGNDETGHGDAALRAGEADSIRLQLTVRELLL